MRKSTRSVIAASGMILTTIAVMAFVFDGLLGPRDPSVHHAPPEIEIISDSSVVHDQEYLADTGYAKLVCDMRITNRDSKDLLIPRAVACSSDTHKVSGVTYSLDNPENAEVTSEGELDDVSDNFVRPTTRFRLLPGESGVIRVTIRIETKDGGAPIGVTLHHVRYHVGNKTFAKEINHVFNKVSISG